MNAKETRHLGGLIMATLGAVMLCAPPARAGIISLYNNGEVLDDYGAPASQLSGLPAEPMWQFNAAAADDFELVASELPGPDVRVMLVRTAFAFFGSGTGDATPTTTWDGITVTVYANSLENMPDGAPDGSGGHTGNVVATQYVPAEDLLNEDVGGECQPFFQLDIPVDMVLSKETRYWLSLVPEHPAPPQSAWCISEETDLGFPAHRGFEEFAIPFWTEFQGNSGDCPDAPPAGTNKDLAFELLGVPEPATLSLLLLGGIVAMKRRR